jgi:hypothetical protein
VHFGLFKPSKQKTIFHSKLLLTRKRQKITLLLLYPPAIPNQAIPAVGTANKFTRVFSGLKIAVLRRFNAKKPLFSLLQGFYWQDNTWR